MATSPSLVYTAALFEEPPGGFRYYGYDVVAADMDNDGYADIAVSWPYGGEVRRGPFYTERIGDFWGGAYGRHHMVFADVDKDGYQDLVDAVGYNTYINIYYGPDMSRVGQLTAPGSEQSLYPFSVAVGDINGDGHNDVAAGSPLIGLGTWQDVGACHVFFGPDFANWVLLQDSTPLAGGAFGRSITIGDYDNDGFDDLGVCARAELCPEFYRCGEALIFFGPDLTTTYRFPSPMSEDYANIMRAVGTGDFNDDGIDDFVFSTETDIVEGRPLVGAAYIFYGPTLQSRDRLVPPNVTEDDMASSFGNQVKPADITGDGLDELVVSAPRRGIGDGAVFIYDFSTRFPFRSYGIRTNPPIRLEGKGDGRIHGSSVLEIRNLQGSPTFLLIGEEQINEPLDSSPGSPSLFVKPSQRIFLGMGLSEIDYTLRLPGDMASPPGQRIRFQVIEYTANGPRTSNGVVWTPRP